jgi:hypothetical protein
VRRYHVQRSVRFQYSQTFLDPFVAPNKIITHFLLIAVVPEILADIVRRVADDNIGGVGFDPSHTNDTVLYILLISISCCIASVAVAVAAATDGGGRGVDEITLLTSSGSPQV